MNSLENLQPKNVFRYFREISQIPRGSWHTKKISDYLVNFAKEHNLAYEQDEMNNVILIKEASVGMEAAEPVKRGDLQYDFPEFAPYLGECRFNDCAHLKEPECAVTRALEMGKIHPKRYRSYQMMYENASKYKEWEL